MIGALLAYLRDGWRIDGIRVWRDRDCWRLARGGSNLHQFVPLPDGWIKPLILLAVLCASCSGAPNPVAITPIAVITPKPLALAGQSNAWLMRPILEQMYRPGVVVGFAQDGSKIAQWAEGSEFWTLLAKDLHQPLRAFVWWQGESDRDDPATYGAKLRELMQRVRREANDPTLLIVECRVIDHPIFVDIRAIQEAYVNSDPRSVLVSSDGLPLEAPESAHLNAAGYQLMVQRILAVIP